MKNYKKYIKNTIMRQYKHIFEMLKTSIRRCNDDLWTNKIQKLVHHILYTLGNKHILDLANEPFYNLTPDNALTKSNALFFIKELLNYLENSINNKDLNDFVLPGNNAETILIGRIIYSFRHMHHHLGEICQILVENKINPPAWSTANMM